MTPKEKAQELVNSFYNNAESRNKIGAFDEDLHKYNCKKCAIIAVDEMLKYFSKETFKMAYPEIAISEVAYLEEVKQEIEKL